MSDPTPSERQAADSSLGELLSEVARDLSTLLRQEIALAKAEIKETVSASARGGGLLGAGAYAALMAVLFLSLTLWALLAPSVGWAWSGLIVAAVWAVIAAVTFVIGRAQLKKVQGIPQTVETLQEIPPTLKRNEENR